MLGPSAPDWLTWAFWARDPESLRNLALTVGAVVGVIVGLPLLCWRTWNVHRQAEAALRQAEISGERGITESFTRAVDQLGSEKLETRLGAIYALERIARESQRDHWPIMETLTAYVREWSERRKRDVTAGEMLNEGGGAPEFSEPAPADIQAVFKVLSRRKVDYEKGSQERWLNMGGAYLFHSTTDLPKIFDRAVFRDACFF